jgi:hypothetical protein
MHVGDDQPTKAQCQCQRTVRPFPRGSDIKHDQSKEGIQQCLGCLGWKWTETED